MTHHHDHDQDQDTLTAQDSEFSADTTCTLDSLLTAGPDDSGASDDFDLDALLSESLSAKGDQKRIADARKQLHNKYLTDAERDSARALVHEWEMKREWTGIANTLMFDVQCCDSCGAQHKHFVGLFQQQDHKVSAITRWIASVEDAKLPKVIKNNQQHTALCASCCSSKGWN